MPIGRTAGSLLMGVITVIAGTLGPDAAFKAIEYETLALLWGMMVLVEYLKDDALFDMFVNKVRFSPSRPRRLSGRAGLH